MVMGAAYFNGGRTMETTANALRLKRTMGVQVAIYLLLGALFSLPGWSEWLQDKLNFVSTALLGTHAEFAEHSLFQAGAFVLVLLMAYLAAKIALAPEQANEPIRLLIVLDFGYAVSGLLFYVFSHTHLMHDLFVFLLFGGLGAWTTVVSLKKPPASASPA
jgi:hypothetical protein